MLVPPNEVLSLFTDARWYANRQVPVPAFVPAAHPAHLVLSQFGGLIVGRCGAGRECATSNIGFRASECEADDDEISVWQLLLKTELISIADVHYHHGELLMDSLGRCFGRSRQHEAFYFEGESFAQAMKGLLLGFRSRPMLRPDQTTVTLYGMDYSRDSPKIFDYTQCRASG